MISKTRLNTECLSCGRDLSTQNRSMNKLPSPYKLLYTQQIPGFSKILPVISSALEAQNRRMNSERASMSIPDSELSKSRNLT